MHHSFSLWSLDPNKWRSNLSNNLHKLQSILVIPLQHFLHFSTNSSDRLGLVTLLSFSTRCLWALGGSLAVVRSYALGCEPLVTGYLAMGLTIRSSHKQELSSVYQFIDVLYSLCIYEALRHWSLSSFFYCQSVPLSLSLSLSFSPALYLCRAICTKLVTIWLATVGRCYYWSHTSVRSVRLYTGECVVDSSTGLWDRAVLLYPV